MLGEFSGPAQIAARAHRQITAAHRNAPSHYTGVFFDISHQFDRAMQDAAFSWLAATVAPIGHCRTP